jgi:hypothetical protein
MCGRGDDLLRGESAEQEHQPEPDKGYQGQGKAVQEMEGQGTRRVPRLEERSYPPQ